MGTHSCMQNYCPLGTRYLLNDMWGYNRRGNESKHMPPTPPSCITLLPRMQGQQGRCKAAAFQLPISQMFKLLSAQEETYVSLSKPGYPHLGDIPRHIEFQFIPTGGISRIKTWTLFSPMLQSQRRERLATGTSSVQKWAWC